jgi:hypothetical protein
VVSRRDFWGWGLHLGTNRLVIVRCGLLNRETVELNTIHPDTGFISLETILYTLLTLQKHCRSSWYTLSILLPEPKYITCTCLCSVDKHVAPSPSEHWPPLCLSHDPLGRWPLLSSYFYCSTFGCVTRLQKHPQGPNRNEVACFWTWTPFFFGEFTLRFLIRDLPTECTKQLK